MSENFYEKRIAIKQLAFDIVKSTCEKTGRPLSKRVESRVLQEIDLLKCANNGDIFSQAEFSALDAEEKHFKDLVIARYEITCGLDPSKIITGLEEKYGRPLTDDEKGILL